MNKELFHSEELDSWHKEMNAEENIPHRGFRRNVVIYELVCYVNNIIACYLSENVTPIPIFIERSHIFIKEQSKNYTDCEKYLNKVNLYLKVLENHLKNNGIELYE